MADHAEHSPAELGAKMDYPEHDKTFDLFVGLIKYGSLFCVALLLAMLAGFFGGFGFVSATILFVLLNVVGFFMLR